MSRTAGRGGDDARRRAAEVEAAKRERRRKERQARRSQAKPVKRAREVQTHGHVWSEASTAAVARPPRRKRLSQRQRALIRRRLRMVALACVVVICAVAWTQIPKLGMFRVDHIEVSGASAVSDLTVRSKLRNKVHGKSIFALDTDAMESAVEELPFVRSATVDRHFPSGVSISISEYEPLALGLSQDGAWLVARDGRVLVDARLSDWLGRVPVVRLSANKIRPGDRVGNEPALKLLRILPATFPGNFRGVEVGPQGLVAYMHEGPQIRLGRDEQLPLKMLVAERLLTMYGPSAFHSIEYVDVSVPERPAVKRFS